MSNGTIVPYKVNTDCTREVLRAVGTDEKEQMVRTMHELKVVVHEVVSPAGLLEAKNAPMERKKKRSERTQERLHRTKGG